MNGVLGDWRVRWDQSLQHLTFFSTSNRQLSADSLRGMACSDLGFEEIILAVVWRMDCGGHEQKQGNSLGDHYTSSEEG